MIHNLSVFSVFLSYLADPAHFIAKRHVSKSILRGKKEHSAINVMHKLFCCSSWQFYLQGIIAVIAPTWVS